MNNDGTKLFFYMPTFFLFQLCSLMYKQILYKQTSASVDSGSPAVININININKPINLNKINYSYINDTVSVSVSGYEWDVLMLMMTRRTACVSVCIVGYVVLSTQELLRPLLLKNYKSRRSHCAWQPGASPQCCRLLRCVPQRASKITFLSVCWHETFS